MVYTYTIVSKPLTSQMLTDETCPICNKKGSLQLTLYMKYTEVFWIPMIGMGRTTEVHCTECGHVVKNADASVFAKKNYPQSIADAIKNLRNTHKRTTWQLIFPWMFWFAVPVVIGIIFIGAKISDKSHQKNVKQIQEMFQQPQPGDIYKSFWIPENNGNNQVALKVKLLRINGDTMMVAISKNAMDMTQNVFDNKQWKKISSDNANDFDSKEYKLYLSDFSSEAIYFEYGNKDNGNRKTLKGTILGGGKMNLNFDIVERK
jgi:transcription elongation factor Elf1